VIVDAALYTDGRRVGKTLTFEEIRAHCHAPDTFAWIGLSDPSVADAREALAAIDLPKSFAEGLSLPQSRSRLDLGDHAVRMTMRVARYVEPDKVELGQVAAAAGPAGIVVVRLGDVNELRPLRKELEDDPVRLAQGPKRVLAEIVAMVLDGYPLVLDGIAEDINEVEEQVFSPDAGRVRARGVRDATQRIYELNREVLNLRRSIGPLTDAIEQLADESRTRLAPEQAHWFRDLVDEAKRTRENVDAADALLSNILSANLTQVSLRQNEDMRKISAWAAILAFPTAIAGIYGMNFRHMPEIEQVWGYPAVLVFMAGGCLLLYRRFKRVGWL
jgi:magnesium transporter